MFRRLSLLFLLFSGSLFNGPAAAPLSDTDLFFVVNGQEPSDVDEATDGAELSPALPRRKSKAKGPSGVLPDAFIADLRHDWIPAYPPEIYKGFAVHSWVCGQRAPPAC